MAELTCWTSADLETQPWVEVSPTGQVEATFVVGVWSAADVRHSLQVDARSADLGATEWTQVEPEDLSLTRVGARVGSGEVEPVTAEGARRWLEAGRHLVDVVDAAGPSDPPGGGVTTYWVVRLKNLPHGELLTFRATAFVRDAQRHTLSAQSATVGMWLTSTTFTSDDVLESRVLAAEETDDQSWVLMHRVDGRFDHVRLDLLSTHNLGVRIRPQSGIAPVALRLHWSDGTSTRLDPTGTARLSGDPAQHVDIRVDRSTDSVLATTARVEGRALTSITVTTRADATAPDEPDACTVELATATRPGPVGVMLAGYVNQNLNDLFEEPFKGYPRPRNFAEITWQDERGLYCSRPGARENGAPDGYRYVLTAQKAYGLRMVWSFNGGAALLLKHGLQPAQFAELADATQASDSGPALVSVGNSGLGARRNRYYQAESNRREIVHADKLLRRLFGGHQGSQADDCALPGSTNGLYFSDSRVYTATPQEMDAFRTAGRHVVRSIVVDRSTAAQLDSNDTLTHAFASGWPYEANAIWTDAATKLDVYVNEDLLRNTIVQADQNERRRGQLAYDARKLLLWAMHARAGAAEGSLVTAFDDIDHFCGTGWFDGDYDPDRHDFPDALLAAACWFSSHPWVRVVTPDDDDAVLEPYRRRTPLRLSSAIDPAIDPTGEVEVKTGNRCPSSWRDHTNDCVCSTTCLRTSATRADLEATSTASKPYAFRLGFDLWQHAWADTPVPGTGTTLEQVSTDLEQRLVDWPLEYRNDLFEIAWRSFLFSTHECMWSKRKVEATAQDDPLRWNDDPFRWEPEDFAISETLQMRNAWTYLNAAVWAEWARVEGQGRRSTQVLAAGRGADADLGHRVLETGAARPPWAGAPVTHTHWNHGARPNLVLYNDQVCAVISPNGGRIVAVFAMVDGRPVSVSGTCKTHQYLTVGDVSIPCDGQRLQNDVFTPNHAYVATDVLQAAATRGQFFDQRSSALQTTWIPDNFDAYVCTVDPGPDLAVVCSYQTQDDSNAARDADGLPCWGLVEKQFAADITSVRNGGTGVVWHQGRSFEKRIALSERTLTISYTGTDAGHVVSNEFTLDLLDTLRGEQAQRCTPGAQRFSLERGRLVVTVEPVNRCAFTDSALLDGRRRVMTHDAQIIATQPGHFEYKITIGSRG